MDPASLTCKDAEPDFSWTRRSSDKSLSSSLLLSSSMLVRLVGCSPHLMQPSGLLKPEQNQNRHLCTPLIIVLLIETKE